MPADLAFELSYLLSEETGEEVEVDSVEASGGRLCVEARLRGRNVRACTVVAACRGLEGGRLLRCLSKTLLQGGRPLRELASRLLDAAGLARRGRDGLP